mmetsp:Transcript_48162/g.133847  ORF Transcript_48162/g.133847 Transcript_48162/m.133847 type:complete len:638 (-) Transcript_48162:32-1945(-)
MLVRSLLAPHAVLLVISGGSKLTPNAIGRHALAVHADGVVEGAASVYLEEVRSTRVSLIRRGAPALVGNASLSVGASSTQKSPIRTPVASTTWISEQAWQRLSVVWLTVSSLAFLIVGVYAWSERWQWLAALFSLQGLICTAYHFCDAAGPQLLMGVMTGCEPRLASSLCHLDHGLAYLLFGQMALALLGPEDPILQRIEDTTEAHLQGHSWQQAQRLFSQLTARSHPAGLRIPLDVLLLNRIGMPFAMLVFLRTYSSWQHFHSGCLVLTTTALALTCEAFWFLRGSQALAVLLRLGFWRRAFQCVLPAVLASGIFFVVMESSGNSPWLHGFWHLMLSTLAVLEMRRVLQGDSVAFAYDDLQRNPVVAHHILWVAPCLGFIVVALHIMMCEMSAHHLNQFAVLLEIMKPQLKCTLNLAVIMASVAATAMWRVVDLVSILDAEALHGRGSSLVEGSPVQPVSQYCVARRGSLDIPVRLSFKKEETPVSCRMPKAAVLMGYLSVWSGTLGVTASEEAGLPYGLRAALLAAFFTFETGAIVSVTVSNYVSQTSPTHAVFWRMGIIQILGLVEVAFLAIYVRRSDLQNIQLVQGCLKPIIVALHIIWPMTWFGDAEKALSVWVQRDRVRTHVCDKLSESSM